VLNRVRVGLNAGFMNLWHVSIEHDCIVGLHGFAMSINLSVGLIMLNMEVCAMVMAWESSESE